jgi:phosphoribosyl-AMP cyclohydrolase
MRLDPKAAESVVKHLTFRDGLVTAVVRDWRTKEVLMVASQNREAVKRTLVEGRLHYWSRRRRKLWLKGEESGNFQLLKRVRIDCDGDAVLYDVEQKGVACHEGYRSCFFRTVKDGKLVVSLKRKIDPVKLYRARE